MGKFLPSFCWFWRVTRSLKACAYCLRAYWLKFLPFNAPLSFFSLLVINPQDWMSHSVGRGFQIDIHVCPATRFWVCPLQPWSSVFVQHGNCKLYHLLASGGTIPDCHAQSSWKYWQIARAVRDTDWMYTGVRQGLLEWAEPALADATLFPVKNCRC